MKKSISKGVVADRVAADEILLEYDFKRGSSNKFASRCAEGRTVIVLEPDVAAAFLSSGEVNEALRTRGNHTETAPPPPTVTPESLEAGRSAGFLLRQRPETLALA